MKDASEKIQAWYFDFTRENEKWFAIILSSKVQGKGLGTKILNMAKQKESILNGWVIDHNKDHKRNGQPYKSPLGFYLKHGFKKIPETRLELDHISAVKIKWKKQTT
ncbi:GNAT family N-acetyltransferase [Flagellimonas sp. 2012CJ39-3]|nr:GNAT family N-acetyltransferase [Muricauda myxillae]